MDNIHLTAHGKDPLMGYFVVFAIDGKRYMYELPYYWQQKIIKISQFSHKKALNRVKETGRLVSNVNRHGSQGT